MGQANEDRPKVDFYGVAASEAADEIGAGRKMRGGSSDCKIQRPSHTLTLADMRARKDETRFKVKAYITPKGETTGARLRPRECLTSKVKTLSFFDEHAKSKKIVPGPGKYKPTEHVTWTKREVYTAACRPKGKLGDYTKVTFTEEIGKIKKAIPPPGKYRDHENWSSSVGKRTKGTQKSNETMYTHFDEITQVIAKEVPASNKYTAHDLAKTHARSLNTVFNQQNLRSQGERMRKIEKQSELGLEADESYKNSQRGKIHFSNSRSKRVNYFDQWVQRKSYVPGVGAYFKDKKGKSGGR